jgi:hypothetical protein
MKGGWEGGQQRSLRCCAPQPYTLADSQLHLTRGASFALIRIESRVVASAPSSPAPLAGTGG